VRLDTDGPGRGVARLSLINGDVSIRRGDSNELIAGALNTPLMVGDAIVTGGQSRAEIQFDHANILRLGAMADVRISELEFRRYMLQLASGTVTFRVLRNSDALVELGTPSVAIRPARKGVYRVTVRRPDGTSEYYRSSRHARTCTRRRGVSYSTKVRRCSLVARLSLSFRLTPRPMKTSGTAGIKTAINSSSTRLPINMSVPKCTAQRSSMARVNG